jgi:arabinose operon protein AraL
MTASLSHPVDGFIFDLDGTVYIGESLLPGAADCIAELRNRGKQVLFVSNKPLEPRQSYASKLTRLGIPTDAGEVITSASVLARYLRLNAPDLRYYVIGEKPFVDELQNEGLAIVPELDDQDEKGVVDPRGIDAVVVAFDRTLGYRKLNTAYQALRQGARFFATNGDATCPMPGGDVPDAGATLAYFQRAANRTPELVAGKPSQVMLEVALERLGVAANRCLITGDRLDTDIRMGHSAGMTTALVLTGVTRREDVFYASPGPDLLLENLGELVDVIR